MRSRHADDEQHSPSSPAPVHANGGAPGRLNGHTHGRTHPDESRDGLTDNHAAGVQPDDEPQALVTESGSSAEGPSAHQ